MVDNCQSHLRKNSNGTYEIDQEAMKYIPELIEKLISISDPRYFHCFSKEKANSIIQIYCLIINQWHKVKDHQSTESLY